VSCPRVASYHDIVGEVGFLLADGVLLLPSLGSDCSIFDSLVAVLDAKVLPIEHPGHLGERVVSPPTTVMGLAERAMASAEEAGLGRVALVGVSLGGMIALQIASSWPERVTRLVVVSSNAALPPPEGWLARAAAVERDGMDAVAQGLPARWLPPALAADPAQREHILAMARRVDPGAYAACCRAIASCDLTHELDRITAETLVVGGADDQVVPPEAIFRLAAQIPRARATIMHGAAHLPMLAVPDRFAEVVATFLASGSLPS